MPSPTDNSPTGTNQSPAPAGTSQHLSSDDLAKKSLAAFKTSVNSGVDKFLASVDEQCRRILPELENPEANPYIVRLDAIANQLAAFHAELTAPQHRQQRKESERGETQRPTGETIEAAVNHLCQAGRSTRHDFSNLIETNFSEVATSEYDDLLRRSQRIVAAGMKRLISSVATLQTMASEIESSGDSLDEPTNEEAEKLNLGDSEELTRFLPAEIARKWVEHRNKSHEAIRDAQSPLRWINAEAANPDLMKRSFSTKLHKLDNSISKSLQDVKEIYRELHGQRQEDEGTKTAYENALGDLINKLEDTLGALHTSADEAKTREEAKSKRREIRNQADRILLLVADLIEQAIVDLSKRHSGLVSTLKTGKDKALQDLADLPDTATETFKKQLVRLAETNAEGTGANSDPETHEQPSSPPRPIQEEENGRSHSGDGTPMPQADPRADQDANDRTVGQTPQPNDETPVEPTPEERIQAFRDRAGEIVEAARDRLNTDVQALEGKLNRKLKEQRSRLTEHVAGVATFDETTDTQAQSDSEPRCIQLKPINEADCPTDGKGIAALLDQIVTTLCKDLEIKRQTQRAALVLVRLKAMADSTLRIWPLVAFKDEIALFNQLGEQLLERGEDGVRINSEMELQEREMLEMMAALGIAARAINFEGATIYVAEPLFRFIEARPSESRKLKDGNAKSSAGSHDTPGTDSQ